MAGNNSDGFDTMLNPGEYRERSARRLYALLRSLDDSIRWDVSAKPKKNTRSADQNAYLWGVVYALLERETGQRKEDWHDYFLGRHFGTEVVRGLDGEEFQRPIRRSSRLKVGEFAEYIDFVIEICAEHNIQIPLPDRYLTDAR